MKHSFVRTSACLILLWTASFVPVTAQPQLSNTKTTVELDNIRFSAGSLIPGEREIRFSVEIENLRSTPISIAVSRHRNTSARVQADLTDEGAVTCAADRPAFSIADIARDQSAETIKEGELTVIPAQSRTRIVFRYADCNLSGSKIGFSGEFQMVEGDRLERLPVTLWGINGP